jgi:glycosyltransferase involved in cell wall biosynthesis
MIKVLFLASANYPQLKKWLDLDKSKFRSMLVSTSEILDSFKNIDFQYVDSKLSKYFSYIKLLLKIRIIIKKFKPDIIISHYVKSYGIIAFLSRFHPHISVIYGSDIYNVSKILKPIIRLSLQSADKIHISSNSTLDFLKSEYYLNQRKIYIFHWGIDEQVFNQNSNKESFPLSNITKEFNLARTSKYIISPRSIRPLYNHELILRSFAKINKKYPKYKLIFLYYFSEKYKSYYDLLKKLSRKLNLKNQVIWIDRLLNKKEMADVLSISEVLINLSTHDLLASTLLEGIACECFPIVSNLKPYYEVISHKKTGFILKNDSIRNIFNAFKFYIKNKNNISKFLKQNSNYVREHYKAKSFKQKVERMISDNNNDTKSD